MAAPAAMAIRVIVLRYGIAVARVVAKHAAKRAVTRKIRRKPKPPGQTESRGGQHTASSGRPGKARKSMRGPSAQKRKGRRKTHVRKRDEEEYWIDSQGTRRYRKLR